MARDYAIVTPQFWTGTTGRLIRERGLGAQVVALYLVTSPHANMLGLYYLPLPYLSYETGIPLEGALEALRSLGQVGFAFYDEREEVVWVPEMARYQIAEALKPTDKRVQGVVNELVKYRKSRFYEPFLKRYAVPFNLPAMRAAARGAAAIESASEAPAKPLRSQDQEQDHDQDQDQIARSRARERGRTGQQQPATKADDDVPSPRPMLVLDETELAPEAAEVRARIEANVGKSLLVARPDRVAEVRARFEAQVKRLPADLVVAVCVEIAKRLWEAKGEQVVALSHFLDALEKTKPLPGEEAEAPPAQAPPLADFAPGARWDDLIGAMTPAQREDFDAEKRRIYEQVVVGRPWTSEQNVLLNEAEGFLFTKWSRRVAGQPRTAGGQA
jgi:hypothetical protein